MTLVIVLHVLTFLQISAGASYMLVTGVREHQGSERVLVIAVSGMIIALTLAGIAVFSGQPPW